jgi:fibronectin type 3 domain-containing protein
VVVLRSQFMRYLRYRLEHSFARFSGQPRPTVAAAVAILLVIIAFFAATRSLIARGMETEKPIRAAVAGPAPGSPAAFKSAAAARSSRQSFPLLLPSATSPAPANLAFATSVLALPSVPPLAPFGSLYADLYARLFTHLSHLLVQNGPIYDAAAQYSATSNPNSPWSYGKTDSVGGTFSTIHNDTTPSPGVHIWRGTTSNAYGSYPQVGANRSGATVRPYTNGPLTWEDGMLLLVPGPTGEASVLRFTVPETAHYRIKGQFKTLDGGNADVHILVDNAATFNSTVVGLGDVKRFTQTRELVAGQTVDFVVGWGNGTYDFDNVGLTATLEKMTEYNPAPDYSEVDNPSSPWSYGQTDTGGAGFTPIENPITLTPGAHIRRGTVTRPWGVYPQVGANRTASTLQCYASGPVTWAPGMILMVPSPDGEKAVLRFAAPADGSYRLQGAFKGIDNASTDVSIRANGAAVFTGDVVGLNDVEAFNQTRTLTLGETVDFVVGWGSNGNHDYDNVGLSVTVTAIQTPVTSEGTDFWLAFPKNGNLGDELALYISARGAMATGEVRVPGLGATPGAAQSFTVSAGQCIKIVLPDEAELQAEDTVADLGIRVTSDNPISVRAVHYVSAGTDGYLALPVTALGTQYTILAYEAQATTDDNFGIAEHFPSQMAVVATAANTAVTITPSVRTGDPANPASQRPALEPFTITLHEGQTYQVMAYTLDADSSEADLTGTTVVADKPIAVFGGSLLSSVPGLASWPASNHLVEQIPPTERWGTRFLTVSLATRTGGDTFKIVVARNNTHLAVSGSGLSFPTLHRGDYVKVNLNDMKEIVADKPILVAQVSNSRAFDLPPTNINADPSLLFVPAVTQYMPAFAFSTPDAEFLVNYANLVVPSTQAAAGDVLLNGTSIPASEFSAIGGTGYAGARIPLTLATTYTLTSASGTGFGAYFYGYDDYDAYSLPVGLDLTQKAAPPAGTIPNAPTNLTAQAPTYTAVNLSWTDNSPNDTGFKVYRKKAEGDWKRIGVVGTNVTTFQDTNVSPITAYTYRVAAFNDVGDSDYSNVPTVTTPGVPPPTPTTFTATAISQARIDLRWAFNGTEVTGFTLERKTEGQTPPDEFDEIATPGPSTRYHQDTAGLEPDTTYTYRIKANNQWGSSSWATASATTKKNRPNPPTSLTAASVPNEYGRIKLDWTDTSDNENGFRIERSTRSTGPWNEIGSVGAGITTYTNSGLPSSTTYYYRVCAYNNGGESDWSNTASATTPAPPAPDAPSNLTAQGISTWQIRLDWQDQSSTEDGFEIERTIGVPTTTSQWIHVATVLPDATTHIDDLNLLPATLYYYRVRAINPQGYSNWSNEAPGMTLTPSNYAPLVEITTPSNGATFNTPATISVTANASDQDGTITQVRLELIAGGAIIQSQTVLAAPYSCNFLNVPSGSYLIRAVATDDIGATAATQIGVTVTGGPVTESTEYIAAYPIEGTKIRVYWDPVDGATLYKLYRTATSGNYNFASPVATVASGQNFTGYAYYADDTGLSTGTTYYYVVTVVKSGVESQPSEEDSAIPSYGAIPWDGTVSEILSKAAEIADDENLAAGDGSDLVPYKLLVMAPDGTVYDGSTGTMHPPCLINYTALTYTPAAGGTSFAAPYSDRDYGVGINAPIQVDRNYHGTFRRVRSVESTAQRDITGVRGDFLIPSSVVSQSLFMAHPESVSSLYVGMRGSGIEVDAGVMYTIKPSSGLPNDQRVYPPRWSPFMRIDDRGRQSELKPTIADRVLTTVQTNYVEAEAFVLGGKIDHRFTINRTLRQCTLWLGITPAFTTVPSDSFVVVAAERTPPAFTHDLGRDIRFKRQISIDQGNSGRGNATDEAYTAIPNDATDVNYFPEVGNARQPRFYREASRIKTRWFGGQLQINGVWVPWENQLIPGGDAQGNIVRSSHNWWFPLTTAIDPTQRIQPAPPTGGAGQDERVEMTLNP